MAEAIVFAMKIKHGTAATSRKHEVKDKQVLSFWLRSPALSIHHYVSKTAQIKASN